MKKRFILINFKQYEKASLDRARNLLLEFSSIDIPSDLFLGFAVPAYDLFLKREFPNLGIISQHVDCAPFGAHTGQISMDALMKIGITGSLLNHSERRVSVENIRCTLRRAGESNFDIFLCVEGAEEARSYSEMGARFISYEPPELIGGDVSVSTAKPTVIEEVVSSCSGKGSTVLVGAGIKTPADVSKSIELGAGGVLVASGVVLAADPVKVLNGFIEAVR